ncbi:MAG TPA: helicase [Chloroflexi bacterium]|nr:helicase [Chloroflexota bacterium]
MEDFLATAVDAAVREWHATNWHPLKGDDVAVSWLNALFGPDPSVEGPAFTLSGLVRAHKAWVRQLQVAGDAAFRVCLRLEVPDTPEANWPVEFLLQARDDPSLLVPASEVWKARGKTVTYLNRRFNEPQERLLTALGYASRLFPPLERSLRERRPTEAALRTDEAYTFLREAAPLLEQSSFGVLVPPWWNKPGRRLGARLKVNSSKEPPSTISKGILSLENLVAYQWEVVLGDQTLTREEFEALVRLKAPLVQLRGQWVVLNPEEIEAAIRFWERHQAEAQMSVLEALMWGLNAEGEIDGLPVGDVEVTGWLSDLLERLKQGDQPDLLSQPEGLEAELRPYQQRGFSWLAFMRRWGLGACLADDMGLGKCLARDSFVYVNGLDQTAERAWSSYAKDEWFDGEGFWATPSEPLLVNAIDEERGRIVPAPVRRLYRQYVRETLRTIRLEDGSSITITHAHRLLTRKGWTNELEVGDDVCVPAALLWEGQPEDPDLVTFLAWQLAEGHELPERGTITISQQETERLEELRQVLQRIGQRYGLKINRPTIRCSSSKAPALTVNSQAYRQFLEARGYEWGKGSREKAIPPFIMQADLESVRLFLRNYFEAEASTVPGRRSIEISSASPLLIQQLSVLLRRFGIWMRLATNQKRATNGHGLFRTYSIGTIEGTAARTFLQQIGFISPEKQRRLEEICAPMNNPNIAGVPASEIVAEAVATTRRPARPCGMHNPVYTAGSQQFSRASLERVVAAGDGPLSGAAEQQYRQPRRSRWTAQTLDACAGLDEEQLSATQQQSQYLLDQEIFHCRIQTIEEVEYDGWVYDFEVAGHHNFVANNILCHNTIQTIALLQRDREEHEQVPPALVVCPTSVTGNWEREVRRFAPEMHVMLHHGADRASGQEFLKQVEAHDVVITSYGLARRDADLLSHVRWSTVILDEAQNIKNPSAQQTKAVRRLPTDFRLALTGTPVENRLSELWSIMHFLNPGFLGSQKGFRAEFALPIERYHDQTATQRLRHLVGPFILRRVKTDPTIIQDLPDKLEMKVYCNLTPEQATLYEAVVRDSMQQIEESEGIQRRGLVLSTLLKLKQICNHPVQFVGDRSPLAGRSGKLARLTEMLEEVLTIDERALVFTQFATMGEMLKSYLQETFGREVLFLHGGTPQKQRERMIQRFQSSDGAPPCFILSLKAGGVGLNLTAANHVFHFDRWWNPAVENQATDRAFRIGQTRNVQVHKFLCVGTLEENIDQLIESKKALAESIVTADESWLTELSTDDLREVLTLRPEAVGE